MSFTTCLSGGWKRLTFLMVKMNCAALAMGRPYPPLTRPTDRRRGVVVGRSALSPGRPQAPHAAGRPCSHGTLRPSPPQAAAPRTPGAVAGDAVVLPVHVPQRGHLPVSGLRATAAPHPAAPRRAGAAARRVRPGAHARSGEGARRALAAAGPVR